MARVTYAIVEHDGGWAYRVDGTFSETFPSREAAHFAAVPRGARAAAAGHSRRRSPGRTSAAAGTPRSRRGGDRPEVEVED